ncbi:MAG: cardiolipin synthase [Spartobacteria bacterium]|nr:cardiolipin synthase [Spartobacteria bacterium]
MFIYLLLHLSSLASIFWAILLAVLHIAGLVSIIDAIMKVRTPQGALAWSLLLLMMPEIGVLLYWVFGRNKFHGYVEALRAYKQNEDEITRSLAAYKEPSDFLCRGDDDVYENIARMSFTSGNSISLLVDGDATFSAILEGIHRAEHYILLEFFIVKDDELGREVKTALIQKADKGIPVYFLYDEVGSKSLPKRYIREMRNAGIQIKPFNTQRGWLNKFQINFRNHRKIVVIDGTEAYVGGLNIGDEYMGRDPKFGHWRDTHLKMTGPCVQAVQVDWWSDWYWSTRDATEVLNWIPTPSLDEDKKVLIMGSGPADTLDTCELFFIHSINRAKKRIWIASPYFIPDNSVMKAMQLAALRGVDVRIMLPQKADHAIVYLAGFTYLPEVNSKIRMYRYTDGFLHQKVMLIDDNLASVGTANMDNRSFRLNFEMSVLVENRAFAREIEEMMIHDFEHCTLSGKTEYMKRPAWFKVAAKTAALFSPIL